MARQPQKVRFSTSGGSMATSRPGSMAFGADFSGLASGMQNLTSALGQRQRRKQAVERRDKAQDERDKDLEKRKAEAVQKQYEADTKAYVKNRAAQEKHALNMQLIPKKLVYEDALKRGDFEEAAQALTQIEDSSVEFVSNLSKAEGENYRVKTPDGDYLPINDEIARELQDDFRDTEVYLQESQTALEIEKRNFTEEATFSFPVLDNPVEQVNSTLTLMNNTVAIYEESGDKEKVENIRTMAANRLLADANFYLASLDPNTEEGLNTLKNLEDMFLKFPIIKNLLREIDPTGYTTFIKRYKAATEVDTSMPGS